MKKLAFTILTTGFLLTAGASAQSGDRYYQDIERRATLAISDYVEAFSRSHDHDGANWQRSADRRLSVLENELSKHMKADKELLMKMACRQQAMIEELGTLLDLDKSKVGKVKQAIDKALTVADTAAQLNMAYSLTRKLYETAEKEKLDDDARDLLDRTRRQLAEMEKVSKRYDQYFALQQRIHKRKLRLSNAFGSHSKIWRKSEPGNDLGSQHQRGKLKIGFNGKGRASGDIFQGTIENTGKTTRVVKIPAGTHLVGPDGNGQRMVVTRPTEVTVKPGEKVTVDLWGFCLDPSEDPPSEASRYYPIPSQPLPSPALFGGQNPPGYPRFVSEYPELVAQLRRDGKLPKTGLSPEMEELTLIQWTIWNEQDNFDPDDGYQKIHKQVGDKATPEQKEELNESIWAGVDLVKKEARKRGQ
jgi:hypothetical protein